MSEDRAPRPVVNPPTGELRGWHFAVPLPSGWVDRSVYLAGGPVIDGFQVSVAVTTEHAPDLESAGEYVDDQLKQLEGQLDAFVLHERRDEKLGRFPSTRLDYAWTSPEGHALRQLQWYVHHAPNVVVVTASAPLESFDGQREGLERIAAGLTMSVPVKVKQKQIR